MRERIVFFGIMVACLLAMPAQAQDATNDCDGQPVLSGSVSDTVTVNAFPSGTTYTDSIDTTNVNGCADAEGLPDSVVCFTPSNMCWVHVRFELPEGTQSALNFINVDGDGCQTRPRWCTFKREGTGSAEMRNVGMIPGVQVCFVGSAQGQPSSATYVFENLAECGTLADPFLSASFDFAPKFPEEGDKVQFTDTSRSGPTGWSWDFGDEAKSTSTEQNPSFTYADAGDYTVELTVTKGDDDDSTQKVVKVTADTPDPALNRIYFVPSAAHSRGAAGSFWVTDMDVNNAGYETAIYRVVWLPRDTDNSSPTRSSSFILEPGEVERFEDVLNSVFELDKAFGAVAIISDSDDMMIQSRTYNLTDEGTFGVGLPAVAEVDLNPPLTRLRILFFTEDGEFRSNLAFQNGTDSALTVKWERFWADGSSIDTGQTALHPWGNTQINQIFEDQFPVEAAYMDVWTEIANGKFLVFSTVVDNTTSDGTAVQPQW